jgi:hypothetical protein
MEVKQKPIILDPYKIKFKKVINSDKFRQAAITFEKYGYYTAYPEDTLSYLEYWKEEKRRCKEGFTSEDGDYISGYFYFYLNYCPITLDKYNAKTKRTERVTGFPRFYDYDWYYYDAVEEAERRGVHLVVIKKRGAGYSFKGGSMLARNFYMYPKSKSYAIAEETEFLVKDGLLTKAWDFMDFIDQHTAWGKKRQKKNSLLHRRASFEIDIDGKKIEKGYKSEIIGVSLKNDPQKARGKRGKLILWEEAGKFRGLKTAWQVARPSVEGSDGTAFGLMIAYGTGGTEHAEYESLRDLFYEPEVYNCLPIENVWDEGVDKPAGFFVPQYYNMSDAFMDNEGNSKVKEAIKHELNFRETIVKNATDRNTIDRYCAEKPFTPQEATLQISSNIFPKAELTKQLAYVRTNTAIRSQKQVGELVFNTNGILEWKQAITPNDITKYRLDKNKDNKEGSIVIWEHPVDDPPYGLYIAGCDPYDHDKSNTNSLGSTFIYKKFHTFDSYYDIIVAEYTGRPDTAEEYYENVRKLLLYYNARLLYENEKKGIFQYFTNKNCDYLLADQPNIINDIVQNSKVERKKGIHAVTAIQDWAEGQLKDWLITDRGDGKLNLHTILSEPLLEELILYNDKGNFDRVIAMMMVMIYKEELHKIKVKNKDEQSKKRKFLANPIYKNY